MLLYFKNIFNMTVYTEPFLKLTDPEDLKKIESNLFIVDCLSYTTPNKDYKEKEPLLIPYEKHCSCDDENCFHNNAIIKNLF